MQRRRKIAALLVVLMTTTALAIDWPQWRGPNRDSISTETGLLKEWTKEGPPLLWKANGLGIGYSTVSVVGGRIYTMGDGSDSSFIRCISVADGKVVWSAKVGRPGGDYPGTRCTPTVDGDMVFAIGQWGDLVAVTTEGKEVWRKSFKDDFAGDMPGWGFAESPLVDGPRLVCTPGGRGGAIVALDKKTGQQIWRTKDFTDNAAHSSIVLAGIGGVKQYVQLTGRSVAGIDSESGKVLWKADRRGKTATITTPIVHDDQVFVTSSYGVGCNLFTISKSGDEFTAQQVYANHEMENHHGGVIRVGDYIYGYSDARGKGWTCLEMKTGKSVWNSNKMGKGSIAYADGHFYLRDEAGGRMLLIEATPNGWKETGRFDQPSRSRANAWPHPVIANGKLFIRDQDVLLCYNIKGN
jgi:outer membrane protein assembly factor BamB